MFGATTNVTEDSGCGRGVAVGVDVVRGGEDGVPDVRRDEDDGEGRMLALRRYQ